MFRVTPAMAVSAILVPAMIAIFAGCLVYFLRPRWVTAVVLVLAALFGALDQYLGSFTMHHWMVDVSLLAAPWVVLPFIAGGSQREARGGALLGLGCTFTALLGYGLMTLSPIENAHLTVTSVAAFLHSERPVFIGGLVTGPLFGWFGQQWRARRAWAGALATAGALCFEQLAHTSLHLGYAARSGAVVLAEVVAGIAMAAYIVVRAFLFPKSDGP